LDIGALRKLIDKLPPVNKAVFIYLLTFLKKVAQDSGINLMSEKNLAIVISPNLCRCPDDSPQAMIESTKFESELVETLLVKY